MRVLARLWRPFQALLFYALILGNGLVSIAWSSLAVALNAWMSEDRATTLGRKAISVIYRASWNCARMMGLLNMDAAALDPLRDERGLIIVANHPGVLDALIIVARLPRAACVMKASLMSNPILGPGARLARYIRNDTPVGTVRACARDLKRGGQLILFPEGTRTTQWPLNAFKPGVTGIAKIAKAPIQVVFIDTPSPLGSKGWPFFKLPPFPVNFTVRLGQRFEPRDDDQVWLEELERYMAAQTRTNVVDNLRRAREGG